jgi:hypothetical protein
VPSNFGNSSLWAVGRKAPSPVSAPSSPAQQRPWLACPRLRCAAATRSMAACSSWCWCPCSLSTRSIAAWRVRCCSPCSVTVSSSRVTWSCKGTVPIVLLQVRQFSPRSCPVCPDVEGWPPWWPGGRPLNRC